MILQKVNMAIPALTNREVKQRFKDDLGWKMKHRGAICCLSASSQRLKYQAQIINPGRSSLSHRLLLPLPSETAKL
jgi:hypothetical protein